MSWSATGQFVETCSCNMLCPCWYGVQELMVMDQGWCATALVIRIREGSFEGVDVGGCDAVVGLHFPGPTLFDADGTGRVYVDDRTTEEQQRALEAILQGRQGGGMEVGASLLSSWLPTRRARIEVLEQDGNLRATVDGLGEVVSKRLVNDAGDRTTMQNAGFSLAFQLRDNLVELAPSEGTRWSDPEMPVAFECKSGAVGSFSWAGA